MVSEAPEDSLLRLHALCLQWRARGVGPVSGAALDELLRLLTPVLGELRFLRFGRESAVTCGWCNHHSHSGKPEHCRCAYWCGFIDCWRNGDPGTPDNPIPAVIKSAEDALRARKQLLLSEIAAIDEQLAADRFDDPGTSGSQTGGQPS